MRVKTFRKFYPFANTGNFDADYMEYLANQRALIIPKTAAQRVMEEIDYIRAVGDDGDADQVY
jgi:hypothetical protein